MNNALLVFVGGGLGSVARYVIGLFFQTNFKFIFPVATFVSNIVSCLIVALTVVLLNQKLITLPGLRMLILVGFCGGLSTFSTFGFETVELIRSSNVLVAVANILISIVACIGLMYFVVNSNNNV